MLSRLVVTLVALGLAVFASSTDAVDASTTGGILPDLQTVVPQQIQLVNAHQREILRFSNGIANTGAGHLRVRPEFPEPGDASVQKAFQEILDANGNVASSILVSEFEFHAEHNHWHIVGVAQFDVRAGSPDGPVVGDASIKTTFCLIDWYRLDGNSPTRARTYWDCDGETQGISPGWVDQYHQSLEGQQLDITGAEPGIYYLVSISNPDHVFVEDDYTNNTAWVKFELTRNSNGNPKIRILDNSPCAGELCGAKRPNR